MTHIRKANNFDIIRIIFAWLVIVSHSYVLIGNKGCDPLCEWTDHYINLSYFGVKGFITISGFLIFKSLERSPNVLDYLWKRVLRIYPGLIIVLLLSVGMAYIIYQPKQTYFKFDKEAVSYILNNLTLYHNQWRIHGVFDKNSNTYNISVQFKMSLQSLIDNPKELLELINECLKPKDVEKKQFGEVFTPMKLVNEMLDKLPKEVWKNKNLKWLDPCCGMGNFSIATYLRLMDELKDEIKDVKARKKHILENMLYMSELNKKNVLICKQIFDINNEYKLNIYEGDSLKVDYYKEFKIKQFNIIMGNPPYQDDSGNKGKGHTLWTRFVELSLNKLLFPSGYLVFVHPSLWRQPEHDMLKLIKTKQILYLEIHDEKDGQKTFKCSTRYDWYILHNTDYIKHTEIKGQDKKIYKIDLRKWNFIPNYDFDIIQNLLAIDVEPINILYSRSDYASDKKWTSKIKDDEYKYPVAYSVNRKNEIKLIYSNINNKGHYKISKLIFGSGATGFYIDDEGNYSLSEFCTGIIDKKENLQKIKKAIETSKFISIIKAISVSKAEINRKILKYFKKDFYTLFCDDIKNILDNNLCNRKLFFFFSS